MTGHTDHTPNFTFASTCISFSYFTLLTSHFTPYVTLLWIESIKQ